MPDTLDVTRAPKEASIAVVRSLPSDRPAPPPTSGKTPESTIVLPASELGRPSRPGTGMRKRFDTTSLSEEEPTPEAVTAAGTSAKDGTARPLDEEGPEVRPALATAELLPDEDASAGLAIAGRSLSSTFRAQLALFMQKRTAARSSPSLSSPSPLSSTAPMDLSAAAKTWTSWHLAGSGSPSHTRLGTRQHLRWTQFW